nr:RNA-binding transcriptional accessory protein [Anaerolineae bacterium]
MTSLRDLIGRLTARLGLQRSQVERTATLFDEENTLPFIARYRKEMTGGLDEEQLARFRAELNALRKLDDRQRTVIESISEQGKLTPELEQAIEDAETIQEVEDLYLPYKPKRRTRAQMARENGLEPVAEWILAQEVFDPALKDRAVGEFLSDAVPTPEEAWQGARDIVAEVVADDARCREIARRSAWDFGMLLSTQSIEKADERRRFELYYEFTLPLRSLRPHQVLALNRGEKEEVLHIHIQMADERITDDLLGLYVLGEDSPLAHDLLLAVDDAYKRLIKSSIEREVRRQLTERADEHAINVFATNLRNLLLTPPILGMIVMGIDPGYRTGCKLAVVDRTGKVLDVDTITPHPPQRDWRQAIEVIHDLAQRYQVDLIAIGNGTASRETEELVAETIERGAQVKYLVVSEAGASVYSASPLARQELPGLDVTLRGAVSIARRVQDPLAELVKIDPKSIGVGMYQHDVDQAQLAQALQQVTESVVNAVGVDVNTASPALLQYVSGLGPKLAERLVAHRNREGAFQSRGDLLSVKGLGDKTYQQAAGFLRIPDSSNLLDRTGIHPESYQAVDRLFAVLQVAADQPSFVGPLDCALKGHDLETIAEQVGVGVLTLRDIIDDLRRPGRDPRENIPLPILREDILHMEDLTPGMWLTGTVRNVVDFGAFVDIGVKQDGLVHISEMAEFRVNSPYELVSVGDVVDVRVLNVDIARGRIGLSMRS